jgi:hypothetical protein
METRGEPQVFVQLVELEERIARQESLVTLASNAKKDTLAKLKKLQQCSRAMKKAYV